MQTPAIEMKGITKIYPNGVVANKDVDFSVDYGEIHAVMGENGAGKSTLMKMLFGLEKIDKGEVLFEGRPVRINSPAEAINLKIGMVHQEFMLVPSLTVSENMMLREEPKKGIFINRAKAVEETRRISQMYQLPIDPDTRVEDLPVGMKQRVEILKALYRDCKVLVLDEPTAVLTPAESDQLCCAIRHITEKGRSVIFISHKLREVIQITDRVTVIRDGKYIGTVNTKDATQLTLAQMMVGRPVSIERKERPAFADKEPVLVMKDVNAVDDRGIPALKNFNLTVHAGEIVGVAGVDGNGQRELAECISGMRKLTSGSITIKGRPVTGVIADPSFLGFIPEDRQKTGLVMDFSISDNLIIKDYFNEPFAHKNILNYKNIKKHARKMVKKYHVKAPSEDVRVRNLSGGNQQKVVIARELDPEPVLDLVAHPTRGLDLGAVDNVLDILLRERNRGAAVLFISAELQEIMALSDRIIVLFSGGSMGDLDGETADQKIIGQMMLGQVPEVL